MLVSTNTRYCVDFARACDTHHVFHKCVQPDNRQARISVAIHLRHELPNSRQAVPVQVVAATPSELEVLITGGVYDPKKTYTAFCDAES